MKNSASTALMILTILVQGCSQHSPKEFAQWRGINRDGIYQETGLMDHWPEPEGPELLWVFEGLGRGFSAPAVTERGIFVNGEDGGECYLFALDLTGKLIWRSPNGREFLGEGFSSTYPGTRSTPTVYGRLVYSTSGEGQIGCFETSTGKERWKVNISDHLDGIVGEFGYTESPAVDREHLYCFPGGASTNLAALNRFTGRVTWTQSAHRDTFAYGSPVLVELPDREILVMTSRHFLITVDRNNGDLLASYELEGYEYDGEHCNTPVYDRGHLYFVSNDVKGQGAVKLELSPDGKSIREIWRNPEIQNNFGGLVTVNDHLFTMVKGNRLIALDPENGTVSDSIRVATGSIIYADGKFICYGNNGTVTLVSYDRGDLEVAGQFKIREGTGQHFSHPVLADGILYIRHGDALMAYLVKQQAL